jgi:tRNA nucleotidyltransferase (CCA-adding enzyme)
MREQIPNDVIDICQKLKQHGFKSWVVGGSIRDLLLWRDPHDWDIATDALPDQVERIFCHVIPTGIAHGTVTAIQNGKAFEITTLRGDGDYSDGRRPDGVVFVDDIETDLARRDFTMNAIAYDPLEDEIIDPFCGQDDIRRGLIHTVGSPYDRFSEDGLRVLRAARFVATLGFDIDKGTEAMIPFVLDTFKQVSKERVRDEWFKIIMAKNPHRAFDVMYRTGMLSITCPELVGQWGCGQNRYHAYDVWTHTMKCVYNTRCDPILRFAALFHDIGKVKACEFSEDNDDYTFYEHEIIGAEIADKWLREYKFSNEDRERIVHLVRHHFIHYTPKWTNAAVRRFIRRVGQENVEDVVLLAVSDLLAKGLPIEDEIINLLTLRDRARKSIAIGEPININHLAVNGNDVMRVLNIKSGPKVGQVLSRLSDIVLEDPARNQRDMLLSLIEKGE